MGQDRSFYESWVITSNITRIRNEKAILPREMAQKLELTEEQWRDIEAGNESIRPNLLENIAQVLGVGPEKLLQDGRYYQNYFE